MKAKVLIIEDEQTARRALTTLFTDEGYEVLEADDGDRGLALTLSEEPDLVLLDIRLPGMDGLTVLERMRAGYSESATVVMTADNTATNAIRATQLGAFDYIAKPIDVDHLLLLAQRALEYRRLEREVRALRASQPAAAFPSIVGHSPKMQETYKRIGRVANSEATVLVCGESGTGKELVANALHEYSRRSEKPLVKVNCAAIPESLLEAELFGHEKGAFTNAHARRIGRFEEADGGTLFLDEIAELSLPLQAKLLRAVQERTISRLGSNQSIKVDFRLIAATAQDLDQAVAAGRFREDLFYRLNVVKIDLPPLRERREDIPLLVRALLEPVQPRPVSLRQDAFGLHREPRLAGQCAGVGECDCPSHRAGTRRRDHGRGESSFPVARRVAPTGSRRSPTRSDTSRFCAKWRRISSRLPLTAADGNKLKAANVLGIQRRLLYEKMSEYGLR